MNEAKAIESNHFSVEFEYIVSRPYYNHNVGIEFFYVEGEIIGEGNDLYFVFRSILEDGIHKEDSYFGDSRIAVRVNLDTRDMVIFTDKLYDEWIYDDPAMARKAVETYLKEHHDK